MFGLQTLLSETRLAGPKFLNRFQKLKIETAGDLLWHFPFRYEDFSRFVKINELKSGQQATVQGTINDVSVRRTWRKKMFLTEALISDETGNIRAVWFNQPYLKNILCPGKCVNLAGRVAFSQNKLFLSNPVYEMVVPEADFSETKHTGRLVPIYPETQGLTSKGIRFLLKPILEDLEEIPEFLPHFLLEKNDLPEINAALRQIHFPATLKEAKQAKRRFAYEDLFLLQLVNFIQRLKWNREKASALNIGLEWLKQKLKQLPFELTLSQKKSLWEIWQDVQKSRPMNRLLQGDVGSGKTVIAALVALAMAEDGKQTVFMAPTEILAGQHYQTFIRFFTDFDKGLALLTSKQAKVFYGENLETVLTKKELLKKIAAAEVKIIIGTHALIQKTAIFNRLSLIVIDEQHRFGVKQRAALSAKSKGQMANSKGQMAKGDGECRAINTTPHLLTMSATPIPRTLALSIFGDLDLSALTELPKNRRTIITKIVAPANREKAYDFIREQVKKGRQVFVVCPRIDAAPAVAEEERVRMENNFSASYSLRQKLAMLDVKAVKEEYEKLKNKIFSDLRVGILHGRMKTEEKESTMKRFRENEIDVLVSTSVVEVGVDIPNASIMFIEGAERFGLAQLYQFRGRVGRGPHQSFCFLFTESSSKTTFQRLHSVLEAKNGLELAEKDLAIRGPGEILGESQTGRPDLAMKALQNPDLVKTSREDAAFLLQKDSTLNTWPGLKTKLKSFSREIHLE